MSTGKTCPGRPLHSASFKNHTEVVKLLSAHPAIVVNAQSLDELTPFLLGCRNGKVPVVQLYLKDPRVDVTLADGNGRTPLLLWHLEVIEWLVVRNKKGKHPWNHQEYTALEIARKENKTEVVSLLERFVSNQCRHVIKFV